MKKSSNSPMSMYVTLYCNKRSTSQKRHQVVTEAIQSWVNLCKSEKLKFINKFNEYQSNFKIKWAADLKNTVPYMKRKKMHKPRMVNRESSAFSDTNDKLRILHHETTAATNLVNDGTELTEHNRISITNGFNQNTFFLDGSAFMEDENETEIREQVNAVSELSHSNGDVLMKSQVQQELPLINKPIPPRLKTAQELFELLEEKTSSNRTWVTLTRKEKSRYIQAINSVKKDYIKKYKEYLENLSSEELFKYYYETLHL